MSHSNVTERFPDSGSSEFEFAVFSIRKNVVPMLLFIAVILTAAAPTRGQTLVRKRCEGGIILRLNARVTTQGNFLMAEVVGGESPPNVTAHWDGHVLPLWSDGKTPVLHGLLGVDLEKAPGIYPWEVSWNGADGKGASCSIPVKVHAGRFPTERLKVENQFVQPNPEQEKQAQEDQKKMKAIYDTVTPERLWKGKFRLPLKEIAKGGNFGRRRILNGMARSPHAGVDFPAPTGTPVFASQAGNVVLAEELYYSGNTVVIDHGYGIYTLYAHLSEIAVHAGERVGPNTQIGKVGATGRVTGPHLHWGLTVQHARVNALNIVQRQP